MWACHSSCGQLSFSLLRLYGHRFDGRRGWTPQMFVLGAREALSGSRGFPALRLETSLCAPLASILRLLASNRVLGEFW